MNYAEFGVFERKLDLNRFFCSRSHLYRCPTAGGNRSSRNMKTSSRGWLFHGRFSCTVRGVLLRWDKRGGGEFNWLVVEGI